MTEAFKSSFERSCRLCAKEQEVTLMIFSEEAEAILLLYKLKKYLLIEVNVEDKLPKNICIPCSAKLQTMCDFVDTARTAQDLLHKQSLILDGIFNKNTSVTSTKGTEVISEPENNPDEDNKCIKLEVRVDPMVVLQQTCVASSSPTNNISVEDVTYLHGVDAENVTIKLIKKGEIVNETPDHIDDDYDSCSESPKRFLCLTCNRGFVTELALKNHRFQHVTDTNPIHKYTCSTCLDTFKLKNELISHLRQHRTNDKCQLCGRTFRSEKTYLAHMSAHLPSKKSYKCKVCVRSYTTLSSLLAHNVSHSTDRPFQCKVCKKSFKRNQDLQFHMNQHTGARPYKCPICGKGFASSGNCYSHKTRMHLGKGMEGKPRNRNVTAKREPEPKKEKKVLAVKPRPIVSKPIAPKGSVIIFDGNGTYKYQCTTCNASFVQKDNFTYHMYKHTGVKPFICSFCTETFMTRRGLLLHHGKEHPGVDRPLALISENALLQ